MKSELELNQDIMKIILVIEEKYPELVKFMGEMPGEITEGGGKATNIKNLMDYYESLDALLKNYIANHSSTSFELSGNSN